MSIETLTTHYSILTTLKDCFETVELLLLFGEDIDFVPFLDMLAQVVCQDIELLMEDRLRYGVERLENRSI